ncbi:hypothetical protein GCM10011613_31350 [Cellvibrio zantedeschiae]|uniref:4-O-methyl-glucuronoyl methylesterase-like domain-containing protein n=1 Tax=Cellvibrio zantedeschiae TaxID=1237077 RepID=A0ABQ3B8R0_9GAMM|nr:dockerin-like protein [Cellvibrio zantedeschiae]GGY84167.1 hypothetical protein GCM10011613_31350 [Cellvibrio zantedeschiae]
MRAGYVSLSVAAIAACLVSCQAADSSKTSSRASTAAACSLPALPDFAQLPVISELPNPFVGLNGKTIKSKKDWACRRAEIGAQAQAYELGTKPAAPERITAELQGENLIVSVADKGKTISFTAKITYPKTGKAPYPAVIGMGGSWLNNEELAKQGVAVIQFPNNDVAEQLNGSSRGKGKFFELYGADHSAGALIAWAWGVSRLIDGLEATPASRINASRLGITGCSRNGKGALVAGAFDERIKLTIPQESGSGGSASWRVSDDQKAAGQNVQTLAQIVTENVWFTDSFKRFGQSANRLPIDQHSIMGMVAPRGLLVIENTSMEWLGNRSAYTAVLGAREIWRAHGIETDFGFSQLGGHNHCQLPAAQVPEVNAFVQKFLLDAVKTDTAIFKSDQEFDLNKDRWINWKTPQLK